MSYIFCAGLLIDCLEVDVGLLGCAMIHTDTQIYNACIYANDDVDSIACRGNNRREDPLNLCLLLINIVNS